MNVTRFWWNEIVIRMLSDDDVFGFQGAIMLISPSSMKNI